MLAEPGTGKPGWAPLVQAAVRNTPALIRCCYRTFIASVIGLGVLGVLMIWEAIRAEWIAKLMGSLGIVAGVSALVLAAYRTVNLARRGDG